MSSGESWREQFRTPAQKDAYIRNIMGIEAAKGTRDYQRAYNRLNDYAAGRIQQPREQKYKDVVTTARATAEGRAVPVHPQRPADRPGGGAGIDRTRELPQRHTQYHVGDTITGTVTFTMAGSTKGGPSRTRTVSGTFEITTERSARLASHGFEKRAILTEYLTGDHAGNKQDGRSTPQNQYSYGEGRDYDTGGNPIGTSDSDDAEIGTSDSDDAEPEDYGEDDAGFAEARDYEYEGQDTDTYDADEDFSWDAETYVENVR